jgi:hypothetical protein
MVGRVTVVLAVLAGIAFVFLALVYFSFPANELVDWIPGADPNLTRHHYTHGVASLAVGVGLLGYGWMRSGKK